MKTLLIAIVLIPLVSKVWGQDTSKIQIVFQTKLDQKVPLFKEVYLGEINTEGYVGGHFGYQIGTLTKTEFLFNAPHTGYFERNKPLVLVMTDDHSYKMKFAVNPALENQKWLLTPPGKNYGKSKWLLFSGIGGIILSTLLVTGEVMHTSSIMDKYNSDMQMYNFQKKTGFTKPGPAPQKPEFSPFYYIIPAITYSISLHALIRSRIVYVKNRPSARQIE
jgi:hypothetical protein